MGNKRREYEALRLQSIQANQTLGATTPLLLEKNYEVAKEVAKREIANLNI